MNIVIVGAGAIGQAIGHIISKKQIPFEFWDKDPEKVPGQKRLEVIIPTATLVFICVPSWAFRQAAAIIRPYLQSETIIVGLSKGLERKTAKRIDEIAREAFPSNPFILLSGPMMADALQDDKPGFAVAATHSTSGDVLQQVVELFHQTSLTVETSTELPSVAFAGVLKNMYAIGLGIVAGLDLGENEKGWVITQATTEMQWIARHLQLSTDIILGVAGLGDLIATGFSPNSMNYRVGRELALHGSTDLRSEGLVSIAPFMALLGDVPDVANELPLLSAIYDVTEQQSDADMVFHDLLP
jgi:glycerol-3-phosphate dehydrogenase (NAD(P)+)